MRSALCERGAPGQQIRATLTRLWRVDERSRHMGAANLWTAHNGRHLKLSTLPETGSTGARRYGPGATDMVLTPALKGRACSELTNSTQSRGTYTEMPAAR
jgi:hypothetical protein